MYGLRVQEQEWDASCVQEMLQYIQVKPFRYTDNPPLVPSFLLPSASHLHVALVEVPFNLPHLLLSLSALLSLSFLHLQYVFPSSLLSSSPLRSSFLLSSPHLTSPLSPHSLLPFLCYTHPQSSWRCHHRHHWRRSKARIQIIRLCGTDGYRRYYT